MPVMKALIEKCRSVFNLDSVLPDLPPTSSGPVFFNDFQMYSTSKKWRNFMDRIVSTICFICIFDVAEEFSNKCLKNVSSTLDSNVWVS